jgi:hypothetical protein
MRVLILSVIDITLNEEYPNRETRLPTINYNNVGIGILNRFNYRRKESGIVATQSPGEADKISNWKSCVRSLKARPEFPESARIGFPVIDRVSVKCSSNLGQKMVTSQFERRNDRRHRRIQNRI